MKPGEIALMALAAVGVYYIIRRNQPQTELVPVYVNGFPVSHEVITLQVPPAPAPAPPPEEPPPAP